MSVTGGLIRTHEENLACFELAGRVLCDGLVDVRGFYDGGMVCGASALPLLLGHEQMADFVYARVMALMKWLDDIAQVVNVELPHALQAPQRADMIMRMCDRMILFGRHLVSWEHDVAGHHAPVHWLRTMSLLRGMTEPLARCLFRQVDGIASLPARVRAGETDIDLSVRVPCLPQFALLAEELPRAWRAGAPFHVRHPVLTALFLSALLAR